MGRRRLVAAMRHAVGALFIAPRAVSVPIGRFHQLLVRFGIAFAEQITGLLPPKDITRRHAPGGAVISLIAGKKIEKQAGMHEAPTLALAERKHLAEQFLGFAAVKEMLLVRR